MAKKGKKSRRAKLRRSCGAMAAHMMLLERFPSYRVNQMRLEDATSRRRDRRDRSAAGQDRHHQDGRQRRLQDGRAERLEGADQQPDQGAEQGLPRHQPRQEPDAGGVERARDRLAHPVQARQGHAHEDDRRRLHARRRGQEGGDGGIAPFNPTTHLNIWVCALRDGLLGYAQFPGGPQSTDGVVINYQAFGTIGTAQPPFDKGRTATHEIGHYFNLRHIWGDTPDCSGSDMVPDTPNCAGPNIGMPAFPIITCNNGPNGDMFVNYMDYTDDAGHVHVHDAAGAAHAHGARDGAQRTE